jgi:NAD(P)-dependent dehydrogenase (short-subunit alcohol dehydrogenase family)
VVVAFTERGPRHEAAEALGAAPLFADALGALADVCISSSIWSWNVVRSHDMADSHALDSSALITGAASGIGRALFAAFRQAGYRAIGVDCAPAQGVETLDVTDAAAVTAFAANLDALTVLVNAAGVIRLRQEYDPSEFMRVVDVNLTGTMRMAVACRAALANAKGAIINVASMHAIFGAPLSPAYAASKAGVVQLT